MLPELSLSSPEEISFEISFKLPWWHLFEVHLINNMQSVLAFTDCLSKTLKQNYQLLINFKSYVKKLYFLYNEYLSRKYLNIVSWTSSRQSKYMDERGSIYQSCRIQYQCVCLDLTPERGNVVYITFDNIKVFPDIFVWNKKTAQFLQIWSISSTTFSTSFCQYVR